MKLLSSKRQLRRIPLTFVLASLAAGTFSSSAAAQGVGGYISQNGGCSVLGNSWEREFQRKDEIRYGKAFNNWNSQDYRDLRSWILRCLDPWIAAPGRVEVFMRNVDDRLRSFDQTRVRQNEIAADRQAAEARLKQQQLQIADLDAQFVRQSEIARAAASRFDQAASSYLTNFKSGTDLSQLDTYEADGKKIGPLLVEAKQTIAAARAIASELEQKGGPRRFMPDPMHANTFSEQLKRTEAIKKAMDKCLPTLERAGIPRDFAVTPILAGSGAGDPFFFEVICPSTSDTLQLIKPRLLSDLYKLNVGRFVTATLWFERRQNANRLVLKRLRTKATDVSAGADWEAMNLMNGALAMLMLR